MAAKKSNYGMVKQHEQEIIAMVSVGKTQKEIAEHLGFKDRHVIKEFLKRKRRWKRKIEQGMITPRRGRPTNIEMTSTQEKDNEIKQLKMENELLRDFLHIAGRK